jgi:AcrR family transcriptional regulator
MRVAIELFAQRGFHGTGIRDIATAAQLKSSTLYHYFGNKDDLLVEIMLAAIQPLLAAARRIAADSQDPAYCLAALVETHVWAHASDRMPMVVVDSEIRALSGARLTKVLKARDEYEGMWKALIRAGVKQELFAVSQPELAARALLQMTTGVSHWFSASGKLALQQVCHEYADWALVMLGTKRGRHVLRRGDLDLPSPDHYLQGAPG